MLLGARNSVCVPFIQMRKRSLQCEDRLLVDMYANRGNVCVCVCVRVRVTCLNHTGECAVGSMFFLLLPGAFMDVNKHKLKCFLYTFSEGINMNNRRDERM